MPETFHRVMTYTQDDVQGPVLSQTDFVLRDGVLVIRIHLEERMVELASTGDTLADLQAIIEARRELMRTG